MIPQNWIKVSIKNKYSLSSYQIINLILATFIVFIFVYSAIFSPEESNHPIPSSHTLITGERTASTGLSRGFSSVIRFQFSKARGYNPYSIQLFLFFLIQFFLRIFMTLIYSSLMHKLGEKKSILLDGLISSGMFILFFEPFWSEIVSF